MRKIGILLIVLMMVSLGFFSGCTEKEPTEVENKSPTASSSATPTSGTAPLAVHFTGSGSDPDGEIVSYLWEFGDGQTSSQKNPVHTFQNSGTYTVSLKVTDDKNAKGTDTIVITVFTSSAPSNQYPIASASASPTTGVAPLTVSFIGSGSDADGTITSYRWSFGNGSTSSQQNPSHSYTNSGTYSVLLTVTDDDGATGTDTLTIFVTNIILPPTVAPTANPASGTAPLTVYFTGTASDPDGSISSYLWDFKDGYTSNQKSPTHTFTIPGTYSVKFTATDNEYNSVYDIIVITVYEDTDGDGIPDITDPDDDNDGYLDNVDLFPKKDAKIQITLKKFKVIDEVDLSPNNLSAQVYFKISINDIVIATATPSNLGFWDVDLGELKTIDWIVVYNCSDNVQIQKINIAMYDKDQVFDDTLDIDGHDSTMGLTINYEFGPNVSGQWTGDDVDGITDGSDDGTQKTDDDDAYLEYGIITL
ncbi:MAG: PKD domain-containing protein [Candidatus Thermoplasmatota archaeon]|nr:PKD domain-containing protein [Candidatus Thermoplasmatota archaeon]